MPTTQGHFSLIVYAPARVEDDGRPVSIVHGMERVLSGLRLGWTTSERGDLIALLHRDEWVAADRTDGGLPFLCTDDDHDVVTVTGWEGSTGPGNQPQLEIHARLPLNATVTSRAIEVLEAVAEGACARWGHMTPFLTA